MSERTTLRLPVKLGKAIDRDFKQMGLPSKNEWLINACEHYLGCKKADATAKMKLIVLQWSAPCKRCGNEVKAGNWALYGRSATGGIVICMDCYVERIGDKALIAKYLKLREWEQISKALKAQCEMYAQRLEGYQLTDNIKELHKQTSDIHAKIMDFIKKVGTAEEAKALEDVVRMARKQLETIGNIQDFIEKLWKRKKRKVVKYEV